MMIPPIPLTIDHLRFAMGSHGLCWRAGSTEVERVSCQARLLGVKPGWSISSYAANLQGVIGKNCWENLTKHLKKSGDLLEKLSFVPTFNQLVVSFFFGSPKRW